MLLRKDSKEKQSIPIHILILFTILTQLTQNNPPWQVEISLPYSSQIQFRWTNSFLLCHNWLHHPRSSREDPQSMHLLAQELGKAQVHIVEVTSPSYPRRCTKTYNPGRQSSSSDFSSRTLGSTLANCQYHKRQTLPSSLLKIGILDISTYKQIKQQILGIQLILIFSLKLVITQL